MALTREGVEAALAGSPGKRCQFHPKFCSEAEGTPFSAWDTSHDLSVIRPDGSRVKLAQYKHAADAALSQAAPDLARALLAAWDERDAALARVAELEADIRGKTFTVDEGREWKARAEKAEAELVRWATHSEIKGA